MDFIICICQCFFGSQAIGAEYGEGFETFRPDGPLKIDVVRSSGFMFTGIKLFLEYIIYFGLISGVGCFVDDLPMLILIANRIF